MARIHSRIVPLIYRSARCICARVIGGGGPPIWSNGQRPHLTRPAGTSIVATSMLAALWPPYMAHLHTYTSEHPKVMNIPASLYSDEFSSRLFTRKPQSNKDIHYSFLVSIVLRRVNNPPRIARQILLGYASKYIHYYKLLPLLFRASELISSPNKLNY